MMHLTSLSRKVATGVSYAISVSYLQYLSISQTLAQGFGGELPDLPGTADGGSGATRDSIIKVINFVLGFLSLVAVIFVIVGGVRILAAGGNEENVTKGRKTIIYAIIGLVVIFFARVIVGFFTQELSDQF